jgi:hypothetical protein
VDSMPPTLRQSTLFVAPLSFRDEGAGRATPPRGQTLYVLPLACQRTLWPAVQLDRLCAAHTDSRLPSYLVALRKQLHIQFQSTPWQTDAPLTWVPSAPWVTGDLWRAWSAQRQQLQTLMRQVGYTRALVDGPWRVFLEYRACDKMPHYRLLWQGVLFGRADIYIDTNDSADVLASRALAYIQHKLAAYLHVLGLRPDSARIHPHTVSVDNSDDDAEANTRTREPRLFKINLEKEKPTLRKRDMQ